MSNKTKERILTTALELFNEQGLSIVSTRTITTKIDISQGHLTYYFRKRADILDALYTHYKDQLTVILNVPTENVGKYEFFAWLDAMLEINYTFRFLFLDFAQVMRESSIFKQDYFMLRVLRKQKFMEFMEALTPKGGDFRLVYQQLELILEFGMMYDAIEGVMDKAEILQKRKEDVRILFSTA